MWLTFLHSNIFLYIQITEHFQSLAKHSALRSEITHVNVSFLIMCRIKCILPVNPDSKSVLYRCIVPKTPGWLSASRTAQRISLRKKCKKVQFLKRLSFHVISQGLITVPPNFDMMPSNVFWRVYRVPFIEFQHNRVLFRWTDEKISQGLWTRISKMEIMGKKTDS